MNLLQHRDLHCASVFHNMQPPSPPPPPPAVGKPGGQRVGERVGGVFPLTWRAGSKFWRLAQNKAYHAVLAVQVSFHFAWHSSISAAPKILVLGNFAEFRRLVGPLADLGGGGTGVEHAE